MFNYLEGKTNKSHKLTYKNALFIPILANYNDTCNKFNNMCFSPQTLEMETPWFKILFF